MNIEKCGFAVGDIVTASDWIYNTERHKKILVRGKVLSLTNDGLRVLATVVVLQTKSETYKNSPRCLNKISWWTERLAKINRKINRQCEVKTIDMLGLA